MSGFAIRNRTDVPYTLGKRTDNSGGAVGVGTRARMARRPPETGHMNGQRHVTATTSSRRHATLCHPPHAL